MAAIGHKAVFETTVQTEIGTTFVTKLTLSNADVTNGATYLVLCYAQVGSSSSSAQMRAQLVHGSTVFTDSLLFIEPAGTAAAATPAMHSYGYMTVWRNATGSEDLLFQIKSQDGVSLAFADSIVIIIIRLDADLVEDTGGGSGDWLFNEHAGGTGLTTSFRTFATVSPFVTSGESWLVIAHSSYLILRTNANAEYRINESQGGENVPFYSQEGEKFTEILGWLLSRVYAPSTGSITFSVQGRDDAGGGRINLVNQALTSRIFAMRLSAFQHAVFQWNSGAITVGTSEVTVATAAVTPTTTADFLMLGYAAYDAVEDGAKMKLFVDESGGNATPTAADKQFVVGSYSATDENPATALAMPTLSSGGAKTFNLVAQSSLADKTARSRSLLLLSMELGGGVPGPITISPSPVAMPIVVPAPTSVTFGAITISPTPVTMPLVVPEPAVTTPLTISPTPVTIPIVVPSITVSPGSITISPTPVAMNIVIPTHAVQAVGAADFEFFGEAIWEVDPSAFPTGAVFRCIYVIKSDSVSGEAAVAHLINIDSGVVLTKSAVSTTDTGPSFQKSDDFTNQLQSGLHKYRPQIGGVAGVAGEYTIFFCQPIISSS